MRMAGCEPTVRWFTGIATVYACSTCMEQRTGMSVLLFNARLLLAADLNV